MRSELHKSLERYRMQPDGYTSQMGADYGVFMVIFPAAVGRPIVELKVISSGSQPDWEHVSVSTVGRCPTWEEMCFVKELFWSGSETVLQFHPKKSEYKSDHHFCLHLWKKTGVDHELPPFGYV